MDHGAILEDTEVAQFLTLEIDCDSLYGSRPRSADVRDTQNSLTVYLLNIDKQKRYCAFIIVTLLTAAHYFEMSLSIT